ncbi:MAG: NrdH-redoxin [Kaistia sp. SCN 65-12]|jgi:glutaredoxin|nr:MAG: NrdH-redoxin [Kaistia sp. SCN 65-12]
MASSTAPASLLIYSTPTCPDCKALKAWLNEHRIPFVERDLTDPDVVAEAKARTGVRVAPITIAGDLVLYGTFASQRPQLEALLGLRQVA